MSDPVSRHDLDAESPAGVDDSRPLRDLHENLGRLCSACSGRCSAFDIVWSIAMGFKVAPRCLPCLAEGLSRDPADLMAQLTDYLHRRECYKRAWQEAARLESDGRSRPSAPAHVPHKDDAAPPGTDWDAGDLGCGELVLALRVRLAALPPGTVLRVRATDPAAPEDIPAWCRLTGHALVSLDHPHYLIRRKGA